MYIILLIILILLLLYYLINNCKYKDIECFNVGSQFSYCNDCEDCSNHGIASGIHSDCSCTCKDGWSGNKCENPPSIRPVFPDKIERLPWNHAKNNDGYISIFLDKMNGKINGTNSYTSRLNFTLGPQEEIMKCKARVSPIKDYKKSYNPVIYNLAQFGFKNIKIFNKRELNKFYKYQIAVDMNLTKDNIPGGIHWYETNLFEFKFYVRTFFSHKDFINNTPCDMWEGSLRVTKAFDTDTINFNGSVDFDIGDSEPCPTLDHLKSTYHQQEHCASKDFCKFDDGTIYNSCDNMCDVDDEHPKTVFYSELYRIDIKLISA